jgi:hypothetical protein
MIEVTSFRTVYLDCGFHEMGRNAPVSKRALLNFPKRTLSKRAGEEWFFSLAPFIRTRSNLMKDPLSLFIEASKVQRPFEKVKLQPLAGTLYR